MSISARNAILAGGAAPGPTPAYWGLCFTAEADNSSVQLTAEGSAPAVTLVKSFDGINWEAYAVGEVIDLPSTGDLVYLAAGEGGNESFGSSTSAYHKFVINGLVAASGDITSLRRFDLEQTTLAKFCYSSMFNGCTDLSLIKVHFTAWGIQTTDWVTSVSSAGTFYKPSALSEEFGESKIPTGWTVVNID